MLLAWLGSQVTPAWTNRYFAVVIGPVVLLAAGGVRHATRGVAIAATILLALFWFQPHSYGNSKASERSVMTNVGTLLEPGDLLISTHPSACRCCPTTGPRGSSTRPRWAASPTPG